MRIEIQLRIIADDNNVISEGEILHLDKGDDRLEVIGLSFDDAKAALAGIQAGVVTAQAASFLARHRSCDLCGSPLLSKGPGRIRFRTAFGTIALSSPRFHHCRCQPGAAKTFSPLSPLLTERMAPELLYLETRWASLVSYGMTAELLKDVLPIGGTADASTVRRHLHKVAARHDADLGGEQPGGLTSGPATGQPIPQEAVIVGIDGGYVRNWHDKKHNFEVIVGKSLAAGRDDRYFGLVRSQDEQPGRRFRAVLRSQDLPVTQAVTMLTDDGDSVRALAGEFSPGAVTVLDWIRQVSRQRLSGDTDQPWRAVSSSGDSEHIAEGGKSLDMDRPSPGRGHVLPAPGGRAQEVADLVEGPAEAMSRIEILEAAHRAVASFYAPVILFDIPSTVPL